MRKRVKRSPIWTKYTDDDFVRLWNQSQSITDVLALFSLKPKGGNGKTLQERCVVLGLDYKGKCVSGRRKGSQSIRISDTEVFCENSNIRRSVVRKRLLESGEVPYVCELCGMPPYWQGKPLTLILDHINGVSNDHRINNLRFLCGNCNSQLSTHCGRNNRR